MAFNFLQAGCKHVPLEALQRPRSPVQAQVVSRIGVLIRACSRLSGAVPVCAGHRGLRTVIRLNELLGYMQRSGLAPCTYSASTPPAGEGVFLPHSNVGPEELQPYGPCRQGCLAWKWPSVSWLMSSLRSSAFLAPWAR